MQPVGNGSHQVVQEPSGGHLFYLSEEFGEGKIARPVYTGEQTELAFCNLHLSDINTEIENGIALKALWLVAFRIR